MDREVMTKVMNFDVIIDDLGDVLQFLAALDTTNTNKENEWVTQNIIMDLLKKVAVARMEIQELFQQMEKSRPIYNKVEQPKIIENHA